MILAAVVVAIVAVAAVIARMRVSAIAASALNRLRGKRSGHGHETSTCQCGQKYRVSGLGRHRIYWPEGAPESEPLMIPVCANCERPLPTS